MAVTRAMNMASGLIIDMAIGGDMAAIGRPTCLMVTKMIGITLEFISKGDSRNVELATVEDKI